MQEQHFTCTNHGAINCPCQKRIVTKCPASVKNGYARGEIRAQNIQRGIQETISPDLMASTTTDNL